MGKEINILLGWHTQVICQNSKHKTESIINTKLNIVNKKVFSSVCLITVKYSSWKSARNDTGSPAIMNIKNWLEREQRYKFYVLEGISNTVTHIYNFKKHITYLARDVFKCYEQRKTINHRA